MLTLTTLDDICHLTESHDLECKAAAGRDGNGELPDSFWETYSAMANTDGGFILLGIKERQGQFSLLGLRRPHQLHKELVDTANNPQKVSVNLLTNDTIKEVTLDGKTLLQIFIPRAPRSQQPVYLKGNPMGNCYHRLQEADQRLDDESVKRLLAEQVQDSRDDRILNGFDVEDLAKVTLKAYRLKFSYSKPDSPWNNLEDRVFLTKIGAWRKDRETGECGLTLAGLLMFGTHPVIQEVLPYYLLDYQERPKAKTETRWIDRLTLDGTWSGNLYDFYLKVYAKLVADIKVPFELEGGYRKDETPIHDAIREALCNVLVHADYSDRASVLIVKRPDMFGFRNPGLMRISPEMAYEGGYPDCRNRRLHQMFRYVGVGDQAGSGIPIIVDSWNRYHWRKPLLHEKREPFAQTLLEMRMIDIFPKNIIETLNERLGDIFPKMRETEQMALAIAATERTVTHGRLRQFSSEHTSDISKSLRNLVETGYLRQTGSSRGAVYHLAGIELPEPDDIFGSPNLTPSSPNLTPSSPNLTPSSPNLTPSSPNLTPSSPNLTPSSPNLDRNTDGLLVPQKHELDLPFVDELEELSSTYFDTLTQKALKAKQSKKVNSNDMEQIILNLCDGHYIQIDCLAKLVNRKVKTLRDQYLSRMLRDKQLKIAFPKTPNHPRQGYTSNSSSNP